MGKYSAVLRRHGKRGFGVPSKAPDVGSFPLYPMNRARYALTIIASPNYDSKMKLRASIAKRALAAHPSLKSYWNQLNRETIKPRLSKSTSTRRKAANPRRNIMGPTNFKYRVSASVIVGSKPKDFSFVMEAPWHGKVKAAEKALAKKLRVRSIKLMVEQDEGEFEDSPLYSIASPSNRNITGAVTIEDAVSRNPRRKNMTRRKNYGALKLLTNPLGMPLGKGQAVVVDYRNEKRPKGQRVHIRKGMKDEALCGAGKPAKGKKRGVTASKAKNITCYRCIKLRVVDAGDDVERRFAGTKRSLNYMVPGGREGLYVSKKKLDHDGYPSRSGQVDGIPFFLGGTEEHPSQTRMLTKRQKAKRRADIVRGRSKKVRAGRSTVRRGEMVANPRSFGQGYDKGSSDYGSTRPMAANALRNRSLSYQEGYLEGYSDTASKPNPKRRKNTKRRSNGKKMSAYNRHVQREMLKGKTMSQAAASWRRR
jgi:hypothetical protein